MIINTPSKSVIYIYYSVVMLSLGAITVNKNMVFPIILCTAAILLYKKSERSYLPRPCSVYMDKDKRKQYIKKEKIRKMVYGLQKIFHIFPFILALMIWYFILSGRAMTLGF